MQASQDRLLPILQRFGTVAICETCVALKLGAFPREVRDALAGVGARYGFHVTPGRCSECLQEKNVIRALAA